MTGPFNQGEIAGADDPKGTPAEQAAALAVARELEQLAAAGDVRPTEGFADRAWAAIAVEPLPKPATAAGLAARRGSLRGVLAALADTWRVAFSPGRPFAVRAQALAFVLVVILATASVGGAVAVGAASFFNGPASPTPSNEVLPASPSPSPAVVESPEPSKSPSPSETVEPSTSPRPGGGGPTPRPTPEPTVRPTDAHSPEPTDERGGDHGGSPGSSPDATPDGTPDGSPDGGNDGGGN